MTDHHDTEQEPQTRTVTDAKVLSAMAHPDRSRVFDALAADGPATASALANRLGLAVGSISHHLKVLATAELVAEAPELARDRRERWWRLVSTRMRWSRAEFADDAGAVTAALAAESLELRKQFERAQHWLATGDAESSDEAFATQSWLHLTPAELLELSAEIVALLRRYRERPEPPGDEARRTVLVFARGFPTQP